MTTTHTAEAFTTDDEGLVPVEIEGAHYHLRCAEELGLRDRWIEWSGGEVYATGVMDINPKLDEHEFMCPACGELFPFVNTGRWI